MAIKYFKLKRKITTNGVPQDKYIATMQVEINMNLEKIAEIIEKKSTVSRGDIMGVLSELETTVAWLLENGHPVTLGLLGTFYPSMEVKAVDSPEEVNKSTIEKFKCIFKPSIYLKKRFKEVDFVLGDNKVRKVKYKNNI
jgi:predicted histone-like DNA-binding protein